ncbi:MAG: HlyD family efflux transporter periplasmic adaptor subunit [Planctomycetota bacterium]
MSESTGVTQSIASRLTMMAELSPSQNEFFRAFAADVRDHFQAALVMVDADGWQAPIMWVADDLLAAQLSPSNLQGLLSAASANPVALSLPLQIGVAGENQSPRGIRARLSTTPQAAAVLIVFPVDSHRDGLQQVADLKQTRHYVDALLQVPWQDLPIQKQETGSAKPAGRSESSPPGAMSSPSGAMSSPPGAMSSPPGGLIAAQRTEGVSESDHRLRKVLQSFHYSLHVRETAYRIANETRRVLAADRVCVLTPHASRLLGRRRFRVDALSGSAVVDRRSNSIRAIEKMVGAAVVLSRPLTLPSVASLPPQVEEPIDHYLDETGVGWASLLPLFESPQSQDVNDPDRWLDQDPLSGDGVPTAVLLIEKFNLEPTTQVSSSKTLGEASNSMTLGESANRFPIEPVQWVASEALIALGNAKRHEQVFGLKTFTRVGRVLGSTRRWWWVAGVLLLAVAITLGNVIQVEHTVLASGKILPRQRQEVFAAVDGVVKEVLVEAGQSVQVGTPLFRLENAEIETQAEVLTGKIQTIGERLSALSAARLADSLPPEHAGTLAIQQREAESELADYQAQSKIIQTQIEALTIRAPIDGIVAGWQLRRKLLERPVSRGNRLATVVQPEGDWELELRVPDHDLAPVFAALKENQRPRIDFMVASAVDRTFVASLDELSTTTRKLADGQNVLPARAAVIDDPTDSDHAVFNPRLIRPGTEVSARIRCPSRSLFASWFSDLVDFYHRNIGFRVRSMRVEWSRS